MIYILSGISGSGKSTYAKNLKANYNNSFEIINRDNIRSLLFGLSEVDHLNYYNNPNLKELEKEVSKYQNILIKNALATGKTPIIDNLNIKLEYIKEFEYYNQDLKIFTFDVSLEEALFNNTQRIRQVPKEVISTQYSIFQKNKEEIKKYKYYSFCFANDSEINKSCYLFDLDGTLALPNRDRSIYSSDVENDYVNTFVVDIYKKLIKDNTIIICSGRNESALNNTIKWFNKNNIPIPFKFYFRKNKDYRKDWIIKQEMWEEITSDYYIKSIFDDRNQVVDRARYLGLNVFQIDYNEF